MFGNEAPQVAMAASSRQLHEYVLTHVLSSKYRAIGRQGFFFFPFFFPSRSWFFSLYSLQNGETGPRV